MKNWILKIIEKYLQALARGKIRRAKPKVIAITGSYGKTSTKEAVFSVLVSKFGSDVGKNWGNMNSVLGVPMAILGIKSYSFGLGLLVNVLHSTWNWFVYSPPKLLVLELGIDKPGEMEQLLSLITPEIAIITGISETHLEGLKNIEGIKKEKELLFKSLNHGVAIKNLSDKNSSGLVVPKNCKIITFGSSDADVQANKVKVDTCGTSFELSLFNQPVGIKSKLLGHHLINSLLIAAAVGRELGISNEKIVSALENIEPEKGRMNPIRIKNQITIIDDSYNSNPKSAEGALSTLSQIEHNGRKIAVIGNMNELGSYTYKAHLLIGAAASKVADIIIAVGDNAEAIKKGALDRGMEENKIKTYESTEKLIKDINVILKKNDLVLIKGSQNRVRLERLVKYLLEDDVLASKLLVRQDKKWQRK